MAAYDNNMDINPEKMSETAASIRSVGSRYQEKVTDIFNEITNMNQVWQGQEYDTVKAKFEESRPALDELGVLVNSTIPTDIDKAVANYNETQNRIKSIFG